EFWCTTVAEDPKPPIDNSEARPLKEFIIKFIVMNVKKPLTLDFKTFCETTGLDFNQGTNEALVNKTPVLKTSFPVAWRILLTFIVPDVGGNYSFTEQYNLIQQLLAYCVLTGTNVDDVFQKL
ncbi:hypothetical protein Tco_0508418, partial [Tanacetum coccineum]